MKINKKLLLFIVSVLVVSVLAVGCAPDRRPDGTTPDGTTPRDEDTTPRDDETTPEDDRTPGDETSPTDDTTPDDTTPDDDTTPNNDTTDARSDEAREIADKVADIEEIDSATCVVTDNTAMVGVQFDKDYEGELTDEIKKKVEDVAQEVITDIDEVVVTADPDIFDRLTTLADDIGEGKPLKGLREEIDEIINRIRPK